LDALLKEYFTKKCRHLLTIVTLWTFFFWVWNNKCFTCN